MGKAQQEAQNRPDGNGSNRDGQRPPHAEEHHLPAVFPDERLVELPFHRRPEPFPRRRVGAYHQHAVVGKGHIGEAEIFGAFQSRSR